MSVEGRNIEPGQILPEHNDLQEIRKYQKNFLEMDLESNAQDVLELKERIAKYGGMIRIMVHPLFELNETNRAEVFPRAEETERGLRTLISKGKNNSPAIFIFEENKNMQQTQEYLQKEVKQADNTLYYVPTLSNDPRPHFSEPNPKTDELPGEWNRIYELFIQAGVKEALVGGIILKMFKTYERDKTNMDEANFMKQRAEQGARNFDYDLEGCVGMAIRKLSERGMKVHLSNFFSADYPGLTRSHITKTEGMRSPNYQSTPKEDDK